MNFSKREISPDCYYYYCEEINENSNSVSNSPIRQTNKLKRKRLESLPEQIDNKPARDSNSNDCCSGFLFHKQPDDDLTSALKSSCDETSLLKPFSQKETFLNDVYEKLYSYFGEYLKIYSRNELEYLDPNNVAIISTVTHEVVQRYPNLFKTDDDMMNEVDRNLERKVRTEYLDRKFVYSKLSNITREDCNYNEKLFIFAIAMNACLKIYFEDCFYLMKSFEEMIFSNMKKLEIIKSKIATSISKEYLFEQSLAINKISREREIQGLLEKGIDLATYRQFDKSNIKNIITDLTIDPYKRIPKSTKQN